MGLNVQLKPEEGETVEVRVTVPANPFTGLTVIVEVPVVPELTLKLVGLALRVKSVTANVAVAV